MGFWHDERMPLELRAGTADDVDGLLALWVEAAENAGRPPDTREAVMALLGRDPDAVIVAEHEGELVGSVIAGWDGWRCHLYRLAVPAWRRQGVASALRAAEDRFSAVGAARAMRWCCTATASARACGGLAATAARTNGAGG